MRAHERDLLSFKQFGWLSPLTGKWHSYLLWALLYGFFGGSLLLADTLYYLAADPRSVQWQLWVLCMPVTPSIDRVGAYVASAVWLGPLAIGWSASLPPYEFQLTPERAMAVMLVTQVCRLGAVAIAGGGLFLACTSILGAVYKQESRCWGRWIAWSWPAVQLGLNALLTYLGNFVD